MYRILGYSENQLGNIDKAINYHKISGTLADKYLKGIVFDKTNSYHFNVSSMVCAYFVNIGLCYFDLWELDKASDYFQEGILAAIEFKRDRYWVEDYCCLALTKSFLGFLEDAEKIAEEAYKKYQYTTTSAWGRVYTPIILGKTHKNLGNNRKSIELYQLALSQAEKIHYKQARANILIGLAEIYREPEIQNFDLALLHHFEALKLLHHLEAKCDLAGAYFQLGLTYQAMRKPDQAEECKAEALKIFQNIKAPKQCDRVNKAFEQGVIK